MVGLNRKWYEHAFKLSDTRDNHCYLCFNTCLTCLYVQCSSVFCSFDFVAYCKAMFSVLVHENRPCLKFQTLISLKPLHQLFSNFACTMSIGVCLPIFNLVVFLNLRWPPRSPEAIITCMFETPILVLENHCMYFNEILWKCSLCSTSAILYVSFLGHFQDGRYG